MAYLRASNFIAHATTGGEFRSTLAARERAAARLTAVLNRPLTVGILGESGSGKSSLLNALFDAPIMPTKGLGRTRPIIHLRYGSEYATYIINPGKSRHRLTSKAFEEAAIGGLNAEALPKKVIYSSGEAPRPKLQRAANLNAASLEVQYPALILQSAEFIEYPGHFNRAFRRGLKTLGKVDIAVWATVASSAWKRSEFETWRDLGLAPRERSILAVTQGDGLIVPEDRNKLMARLRMDASDYFFCQCLVSAKLAVQGQMDTPQAQDSGLEALKMAIEGCAAQIHQRRLSRAAAIYGRFAQHPVMVQPRLPFTLPSDALSNWNWVNKS